jgi:hypothetical protein
MLGENNSPMDFRLQIAWCLQIDAVPIHKASVQEEAGLGDYSPQARFQ